MLDPEVKVGQHRKQQTFFVCIHFVGFDYRFALIVQASVGHNLEQKAPKKKNAEKASTTAVRW